MRYVVFALLALFAGVSLADGLDKRLSPLVESAQKIRLLQGETQHWEQTEDDERQLELLIRRAQSAIDLINSADPEEILPILAASSGPNKIVVGELEDLSRRSSRLARTSSNQKLIEESRALRESIKLLLKNAYAYRQGAAELEPKMSEHAQKQLAALRAITQDPELAALKKKENDPKIQDKVKSVIDALVVDRKGLNIEDICNVMKAIEEDAMLAQSNRDLRWEVKKAAYRALDSHFGLTKKNIFDDVYVSQIMPPGLDLLISHLKNTGKLPQDLAVFVAPSISDLKKVLSTQLNARDARPFAVLVYQDWHVTPLYFNKFTGVWRGLVADSLGYNGMFSLQATILVRELGSFFETDPDELFLYVLNIGRQADSGNCLTFALEDLKYIARQPDIFATLKLEKPTAKREMIVFEVIPPCWGLVTQRLNNLPKESTKDCLVGRKGFARVSREQFIEKHSAKRLTQDSQGLEVEKTQYLAIEKRAVSNRINVLRLFLESIASSRKE